MKKSILLLFFLAFSFLSFALENSNITGNVSDNTGENLMGVSILVKGTSVGTLTDHNGDYSIQVTNPSDAVLVFSYMGYLTEEVKVNNRSVINIVLAEDKKLLDEIVVIGYGVSKKSDLTGAVSSVKAENLEKFPVANVTEMLRGQVPGMQVTINSAAPGGSSDILIRGNRSISSTQSPLYVVDGMIVPHINDLNSSDIESIEVLKDASSQAIYGSKASNGVILITTQRGKEGKTNISLNTYYGVQRFNRNFDLYSPEEWIRLRYWAKANDGTAGIGTLDDINYQHVIDDEVMYDAYINNRFTDWEDLMLGNAPQFKTDLNISGGNDKLKYAGAFGYFDQDGIVEKSGYRRGTFRSNIDYAMFKWLDLGVNVSYTQSKTKSTDANFYQILTMPNLAQAYDENGDLLRESTTTGTINPLWRIREYTSEQRDQYLTLNTSLLFKPFKDFTYRFTANIRNNNREIGTYKTKLYPSSTGDGSLRNFTRGNWLINNVINYTVPIKNPDHKLSLTLIHEAEQDRQKTTGYDFIKSTTDIFLWDNAANAEVDKTVRSISQTRSLSFAGRLQYNFMERYLLTASIRRDGASVFGKNRKWANFPSVAFAWRMNEEDFLKDQKWLDMLKPRISYGVVGNWGIPAYRTLGIANSFEYLFGNDMQVGYFPGNELINPDLKWETTGSFNAGVDLSAFAGKLNVTIDYYNTKTTDLLIKRTIPSITSYSYMWDNIGETKSRGVEIGVNGTLIRTKDFQWEMGINFAKQKNEIVKLDGRVDDNGKPIDDTANNWFIGESINVTYNYVFGGIWQEDETPTPNQYLPGDATPVPGDVKLLDYNGDGEITTDDRKIYNLDPDWFGTINTKFAYKGIDLGVEFYTVQGVTKSNPFLYNYDHGGSLNGKLNGMKVNYWTPENRSNDFPRPQYSATVPYIGVLGLQDASYFRLRSLTLGYTLPKNLLSKIYVEKARVYFTGTNLFTSTDYKSYSPEQSASAYPEAQTFVFGLNLNF